MSYIGNPIVSTDFPKDTFSGNGSTTAFTMSIAPASVNAVMVIVSGVTQDPSTYTISGTTLTFSTAPPTGTSNISVRHLGVAGVPNTPSAGSVVTASIADSNVTTAKIADANVTQSKLASGVAGSGPAFRATKSVSQSGISNTTFTKCSFQTETFDTNSCYDNSTNYRFTPTVAGYYQVNATIDFGSPTISNAFVCIYKNGSIYTQGGGAGTCSFGEFIGTVADIVYCNGSTDYIEIYGYLSSNGTNYFYGGIGSIFSASMIRSA